MASTLARGAAISTVSNNADVADKQPDIAALEDKARQLVREVHDHIQEWDDARAVSALMDASDAALAALQARIESGNVPPRELSEDDHAAWALLNRSSTEFQHGNQSLGVWYRESARRRALERYDPSRPVI
jgi:hypothetical protein